MEAETQPPTPPVDETTIPSDTPTNRLHFMQMKISEINDWVARLQKRRAAVAEKVAKVKANKNIARTLTVDKQFKKLFTKLENNLEGVEDDLERAIEELNKMRALFLEASDGELVITKTEIEELKNGTA